jgi:hypothetical protein
VDEAAVGDDDVRMVDLLPYRCPECGDVIIEYGHIMALPAEVALQYPDGPPEVIPDGVEATWHVEPCGHEVSLVQLREMGIEPERSEHPDQPV